LAIVVRDSEMSVQMVFKNTHIANVSQEGMKVEWKGKISFIVFIICVELVFRKNKKYAYRFFPSFNRLIKKITVGSILEYKHITNLSQV
jgi:hypothetical protein